MSSVRSAPAGKRNRISYEEWLKSHGIVGKSENIDCAAYQHEPVINYLFENNKAGREKARDFLETILQMSPATYLNKQILYPDSLTNKLAIAVNAATHEKLLTEYQHYLEKFCKPRAAEAIQQQLLQVEERLTHYQQQSTTALKKLQSLSTNEEYLGQGWDVANANQAFQESLINFLALHQDRLSADELRVAHQLVNTNDDSILATLQSDNQWWETSQQQNMSLWNKLTGNPAAIEKSFLPSVNDYAARLLNGYHPDHSSSSSSSTHTARDIPRFFPDQNGRSETDAIYLNSGGMKGHATVTKIWKQGVDPEGNIVTTNPQHFKFYCTEYNAGIGAEYAAKPYTDPKTGQATSGIVWTTSTREILPAPDGKTAPQKMFLALQRLIESERMAKLFRDPSTQKDVSPSEAAMWDKWDKNIKCYLSPKRIDALSSKGVPQQIGNCTAMSLKVMTENILGSLAEEHWYYTKGKSAVDPRLSMQTKLHALQRELAAAEHQHQSQSTASIITILGCPPSAVAPVATQTEVTHASGQTPPMAATVTTPDTTNSVTAEQTRENSRSRKSH